MYSNIMIVVDEGAQSRAAVLEGLELAKSHAAEVLFFHVVQNYVVPVVESPSLVAFSPEEHRRDVERLASRVLAAAETEANAAGVRASTLVGSGTDTAECIARTAAERSCDLIVVGSHGRTALQRLVYGSVVTRLITFATVPVLVCKSPGSRKAPKGQATPKMRRTRGSGASLGG